MPSNSAMSCFGGSAGTTHNEDGCTAVRGEEQEEPNHLGSEGRRPDAEDDDAHERRDLKSAEAPSHVPHQLRYQPGRPPACPGAEPREDHHGHELESRSADRDRIDLLHVEAFGAVRIRLCFLPC